MINLGGVDNTRIDVACARFDGLASRRCNRPIRVKNVKMRRLVAAAETAGIHPCKLIEWTFKKHDTDSCLGTFGIAYPPIEYTYSHFNLTHACLELTESGSHMGRMSHVLSKVMNSEYLSANLQEQGVVSAVITKTLCDEWIRVVCASEGHPLHAMVKKTVQVFDIELETNVNEDELEYVWNCIKEANSNGSA